MAGYTAQGNMNNSTCSDAYRSQCERGFMKTARERDKEGKERYCRTEGLKKKRCNGHSQSQPAMSADRCNLVMLRASCWIWIMRRSTWSREDGWGIDWVRHKGMRATLFHQTGGGTGRCRDGGGCRGLPAHCQTHTNTHMPIVPQTTGSQLVLPAQYQHCLECTIIN